MMPITSSKIRTIGNPPRVTDDQNQAVIRSLSLKCQYIARLRYVNEAIRATGEDFRAAEAQPVIWRTEIRCG